MNNAEWIQYVRNSFPERTATFADNELLETYVPSDTKFLNRSIGKGKAQSAQNNSAWTKAKKSAGRPEDVYRTKVENIGNGIGVITLGSPLRGTASLSINDTSNNDRRRAGERVLDLFMQVNPGLDRQQMINDAKYKYAYINQLLGKETHHMLEISGTNALLDSLPPEERLMAAERLVRNGFSLGDAAANQVALFGSSNPGPTGSAPTKMYPEQNQHQSGVHSEQGFKAIANEYGFPSLRNSTENVLDTSVPRFARNDESMQAMIADLRQLQAASANTVSELIDRQESQDGRMAVVDMYGDLSRLAVQEAVGIGQMADGNTDKNNSAIRRSLNRLDQSYRQIAGDDVADFERGFMEKLGIDMDDELLRNKRSGRRR